MSDSSALSIYSEKVRVRVCGLLIVDESVLMLKHVGIGTGGWLWAPPGGGLEFNENAPDALRKEFREETGLEVTIDQFLFVNEYRDVRLHAIELFFSVHSIGGTLQLGSDPELPDDQQIIKEIKWLSVEALKEIETAFLHNAFHEIQDLSNLRDRRGFFKFENNSIK